MSSIRLIAFLVLLGFIPFGAYDSAAALDEGNGLDPHGGSRISASADEGNGIDPHG